MQIVTINDREYAGIVVPSSGKAVTLLAETTDATAHSVNGDAVTGLGHFRQAMLLLNVTDCKAAAGDHLDVYIDTSPDEGTTWVNVGHFTQQDGNGADAFKEWMVLDPGADPGTASFAVTSDAAETTVRPTMFCDRLRVRYTVTDGGAHGQSFTFAVTGYFK